MAPQTYSGAPLGAHVIKPQIDAFNAAANGEMEIELYYADQLVPTADLFRALQTGTLDAVQSDDATMASPVDISVFGGYFPFATRYSLDVPALYRYCGLKEIWEEAYGGVERHLAFGRRLGPAAHLRRQRTDPQPRRHERATRLRRADGGQIPFELGLIPVTIQWDDVEVAMQAGELDGVAWCGFTEAYEVGWADVCRFCPADDSVGDRRVARSCFFANTASWEKVPPHLQQLFRSTIDQSHLCFPRNRVTWGGEAKLRVEGEKMELTQLPPEEWAQVVKDAEGFWDEVSTSSARAGKVVEIFKKYAANMDKAGYPYR